MLEVCSAGEINFTAALKNAANLNKLQRFFSFPAQPKERPKSLKSGNKKSVTNLTCTK